MSDSTIIPVYNNTIEITQQINELSLTSPIVFVGDLNEKIDNRVSDFLLAGSGIYLNYNNNNNQLIISTSGNYSFVGHTHNISDITDFSTNSIAKAWINFNGTGAVSIRASYNILSLIDNGTGDYTINFINPFADINYAFVTWCRDFNNDAYITNNLGAKQSTLKTNSSVRLTFNYLLNALNYDSSECNIIFFGN